MKFNEFKYERPNLDTFKNLILKELNLIATSKTLDEEIKAIKKINDLNDELQSMATLVSIRNSINTKDPFYEEEQAFFDENMPVVSELFNILDKKLLASKHIDKLKEEFGELLFKQTEVSLKTFKPEIIEDLQLENKLTTEYVKLKASAEIEFKGKVYNLSQMSPFAQSTDRNIRKEATLAVSNFYKENISEFDRIYDELVKVRTKIAKKLGYKNFIELGYDRMGRTDYNELDVKKYRKQILEEVVPYVKELIDRKSKRLKIKNMQSYDLNLSFLDGNPTPKGNLEWQVNEARKMYDEMSKETSAFFNMMIKRDLLELDSKPGKAGGGYCTYIPKYEAPFIFANFNGTSHDVDVLTHEAGHAFQVYESRNLDPNYRWPTMEAAEIHSMSMEFLAWPWMENFFKEDTNKYKFNHLAEAVSFLPYGALVDHFQHEVYENYDMTPEERRLTWRKLEKMYMPYKKYDEDNFLEEGGFWIRQGHIYEVPFYYIDYTLAQVCALQYWDHSQKDFDKAWESYLKLSRQGGSKSFVELINSASLKNPFEVGSINQIMDPIKAYLNNVDDLSL